ncbi:MAG: hypothetical protein ACHWZW_01265 [Spirulina sp.]
MFIDPLDSPNLLRKIDDNHVIDGFGNRYELVPRDPNRSPGGGWFLLLSILAAILLL